MVEVYVLGLTLLGVCVLASAVLVPVVVHGLAAAAPIVSILARRGDARALPPAVVTALSCQTFRQDARPDRDGSRILRTTERRSQRPGICSSVFYHGPRRN